MNKTLFRSTFILVIIYFFGFVGTFTPWKDLFLLCTPINLLISAILLFFNHKNYNTSFYVFCILSFLAGYFLEVIGVKTGYIFGEYEYGHTLGLKLINVPLVIGINWMILIYSAGVICNQLKMNLIFKSVFGAVLLVVLDFFIEPVAIKFDFWSWRAGIIPLQNYVAWFIASTLLLMLFYSLKFNKDNELAKGLYIVQLVFFILLNIF